MQGANPVGGVLIVEDEHLIALDLEGIVAGAGHEVVGVVSDQLGADQIGRGPEVALVDLNLRDGLTGPAIARSLASRFGTAIIFVTANPDQIDQPPATALGYIQKPFHAADILGAISMAVGHPNCAKPCGLHALH
ncbi:MAG: response regulator [Proteobacteria bacterium]|nr:response regulator [Pseudomonadota bacterium]